jgi:hypothetical protein
MLKKAVVSYFKALARYLLEDSEEKNKKISVRISDVPAVIRTQPLPSTSLQYYLYTNFPGQKMYCRVFMACKAV